MESMECGKSFDFHISSYIYCVSHFFCYILGENVKTGDFVTKILISNYNSISNAVLQLSFKRPYTIIQSASFFPF